MVGDYVEKDDIKGVEDAEYFYNETMKAYKNVGWLARKVLKDNTGVELVKDYFKIKGMYGNITTLHTYKSKVVSDLKFVEDEHGDFIAQGSALDHLDDYVGVGRTMRQIVQHFDGDVMTAAFILLAGTWAGNKVGIIPDKDAQDFVDITMDLGTIKNL